MIGQQVNCVAGGGYGGRVQMKDCCCWGEPTLMGGVGGQGVRRCLGRTTPQAGVAGLQVQSAALG